MTIPNLAGLVLFEDEALLVLNKPAGLMVEPDRNGHPNLLQLAKKYLQNATKTTEVYLQHIHRLDRPVSGIILFAKQRSVLKNLSEQFAERSVKKFYQALTDQAPVNWKDQLTHWHRKEKKKAILYDQEIQHSEKASLHYEVTPCENGFLWNIELLTGKYHQIRAQLSHIGCPIRGDRFYGSPHPYHPDQIALHACRLIFYHPIANKELAISQDVIF